MSHPDLRALASMQAPRPGVLRSAALEMGVTSSSGKGKGGGGGGLSPGRGGGAGAGNGAGLPTRAPGAPGGPLGTRRLAGSARLVGLGLAVITMGLLAVSWARPGPALEGGNNPAGGPPAPAWAQHRPGSAWPPPSGGGGPSDLHTPSGPHLTGLAALCGVADGGDPPGGGRGGGGGGAGATPVPAPYTHRGLAPCLAPDASATDPGARVGQPTVALLFLSAGDLAHAPTWNAWLAGAAGALRADCVAADVCAAHPPRRADEAPAAGSAGMGVVDPPGGAGKRRSLQGGSSAVAAARAAEVARLTTAVAAARAAAGLKATPSTAAPASPAGQALFTVYVHTPPNATLPASSPFAGREIADRVATAWGSHSIVEATRRLLAAALADPRNQRFVLLSETCAPLYPAAATYAQLMAEPKSRVNACAPAGADVGIHRFSPRMVRGAFKKAAWRKSSQWVTLVRSHAARLVADADIAATFAQFCVNGYDPDLGAPRYCHSDEHYVPSALAAWGLEAETDCVGGGTAVDWSGGGSHPSSYWHHDISGDLIERLRAADDQCEPEAAMDAARAMFVRPEQLAPGTPAGCAWARPRRPGAPTADLPPHLRGVPTALPVLGPKCTLFARKFVPEAAERLLGLVQGDDGLRLLEAPQPACRNAG